MSKVYLSPSNQTQNIGYGNYGTEKSRMIQVAEVVQRELLKKFEVKMAQYESNLSTRAIESNKWGSDAYVAIHSNAGGGRGCEVYAFSTTSKGNTLAHKIYDRLSAVTPSADRGIKYSRLYETRVPSAPACLIEVIFHDNKEDAEWLINNIELAGKEIAKGIYDYFGVAYEEGSTVAPTPAQTEPSKTETKELGDIGKIQKTLNERYGLNIAVDDVAGNETKRAIVIGLQKEHNLQFNSGLAVDGVFGVKTRNACEKLRIGARGKITWLLQARLRCLAYNTNGVDGVFGNGTLRAVKQFQKNKKISVDGVVGRNTWSKLFN